jgi:D-arabinose 5-phosphate isomerase GutQ
MSLVEDALRSQKSVWKELVQEITKHGYAQMLPPQPPKRIVFFGVGSSYFSAKLSALSLIREALKKKNRIQAPVVACSSPQIGVEIIPERGDWVFAFSHRGKTPATVRAAEECARVGAFVVWVSARDVSLPPSARLQIVTSPLEKCEPHTVGMTSAVCAVTTVLSGPAMAEYWNTLSSMPNPSFSALRERAGKGPEILLGEWEGEWIAREIRLKLIEMVGLFPSVFGSEEFFHGPDAVLKAEPELISKNDLNIWYFAHPDDLRKKEIKAAYPVSLLQSHSVGWVSALVEMQWLSLAVALNLGKNPDGVSVA